MNIFNNKIEKISTYRRVDGQKLKSLATPVNVGTQLLTHLQLTTESSLDQARLESRSACALKVRPALPVFSAGGKPRKCARRGCGSVLQGLYMVHEIGR